MSLNLSLKTRSNYKSTIAIVTQRAVTDAHKWDGGNALYDTLALQQITQLVPVLFAPVVVERFIVFEQFPTKFAGVLARHGSMLLDHVTFKVAQGQQDSATSRVSAWKPANL